MRTVVQVWIPTEDRKPPSTLDEALGLAARMARAAPGRGERLLALRVALLDRYPLVPAAEGEPSVWADDALAQVGPGPSWDIAIAPAASYEVRPYVIALAGRFGLDACDRETGEVWLAGGDVFSRDDRAPCMAALAAWRQGDFAAAHDALCELAQSGNATALWHLGTLYDEAGGFVQCNALIACALFGMAVEAQAASAVNVLGHVSGKGAASTSSIASSFASTSAPATALSSGAAAPTAERKTSGTRRTFDRVAFTSAYRERIGPDMSAAADDLQVRLREPGEFRRALREAGGPRDVQFAEAVEALARADVAAALHGLLSLAELGHVDAQRTTVRLWASGEAVPPDARRELDWTRMAAQAGDDAGMAGLATLLDEGLLVPRDAAQAAHWLRRLVRRGRTAAARDSARERLMRLERTASPTPSRVSPSAIALPVGSSAIARNALPGATVRNALPGATARNALPGATVRPPVSGASARSALPGTTSRPPVSGASDRAATPGIAGQTATPGLAAPGWAPASGMPAMPSGVSMKQAGRVSAGARTAEQDGAGAAPAQRDAPAARRPARLDPPAAQAAAASSPVPLDAGTRARGREAFAATIDPAYPDHGAPTLPAPIEAATSPVEFAPAPAPVRWGVPVPEAIVRGPGQSGDGRQASPPGREVLDDLRAAFQQPPGNDERPEALRLAQVAITGAILFTVVSVIWFVSFGWPVATALCLLAGACACRAAVQAARIAGDSPAAARVAAVLAFVPLLGLVLAALLMHRAGRALRNRLPPSMRRGRDGQGHSRQARRGGRSARTR